MYSDPSLSQSPLPPDIFNSLHRLDAFFQETLPTSARGDYANATELLIICTKLIAHAGIHVEPGMVFVWPYTVSDAVISDIRSFYPPALLLFAYYSVLIVTLEHRFWYLARWGRQLFSDIEARLAGHAELREMMDWPKERISG